MTTAPDFGQTPGVLAFTAHVLPSGAVVLVGAPIVGRATDKGEPLHPMVRLDPGGTVAMESLPAWSFPGAGKGERLPPGEPFTWGAKVAVTVTDGPTVAVLTPSQPAIDAVRTAGLAVRDDAPPPPTFAVPDAPFESDPPPKRRGWGRSK